MQTAGVTHLFSLMVRESTNKEQVTKQQTAGTDGGAPPFLFFVQTIIGLAGFSSPRTGLGLGVDWAQIAARGQHKLILFYFL